MRVQVYANTCVYIAGRDVQLSSVTFYQVIPQRPGWTDPLKLTQLRLLAAELTVVQPRGILIRHSSASVHICDGLMVVDHTGEM